MTTTRRILVIAAIAVGAALAGCSAPWPAGTVDGTPTHAPTVTATQAPAPPTPSTVTVSPTTPAPPTSSSPAPPSPAGVSIPFTKEYGGGAGIATVWTATWHETNEASLMSDKTPKNGAYLVLDVGVTGTAGSVHLNPYDWEVKDAVGRSYDYDWMSPEPVLGMDDLAPGDVARGYLGFDVPQGQVTVSFGKGIRWVIPAS